MRNIFRLIVFIGLLIIPACASQTATSQVYEPGGQVSVDLFYQQLSPHGLWINYPGYGRVWIPDVGWGFSPYATSGHWVYTSFGWSWNSYYSWGWAPFHYGRWLYDPMYGWMWIPDTIWGPAWVVWSTGGGYCGWAPLGPRVSVNVVVSGRYTIPREQWVFVREADLPNEKISRYRVNESRNGELLSQSFLVKETRHHRNATYMPGPDRKVIQKAVNNSKKSNDFRGRNRSRDDRMTETNNKSRSRSEKEWENIKQQKNDDELRDAKAPGERNNKSSERYKSRDQRSNDSRQYTEKQRPENRYPGKGNDQRGSTKRNGKKGG